MPSKPTKKTAASTNRITPANELAAPKPKQLLIAPKTRELLAPPKSRGLLSAPKPSELLAAPKPAIITTARKPAKKRAAPKSKPNTDVNAPAQVAAYMEQLDYPLKAEVDALRKIIHGVNKNITEQIKWNAPSFSYKGYLVTFNLHDQKQVRLVFHNGAILHDTTGLLQGDYPDRRLAYFSSMKEVKAKKAALETVIREWITLQEND